MAVLQPQHRRPLSTRALSINQCVKQLRSGRLVRPWTQSIEVSRLKIVQRRREQRKKQYEFNTTLQTTLPSNPIPDKHLLSLS
jgi:hypothetical protein